MLAGVSRGGPGQLRVAAGLFNFLKKALVFLCLPVPEGYLLAPGCDFRPLFDHGNQDLDDHSAQRHGLDYQAAVYESFPDEGLNGSILPPPGKVTEKLKA